VSGIFGILNMGKEALAAQQMGINITGHNISNVNTEGYSRQRVTLETDIPVSNYSGQVGTGVNATQVLRVYDRFVGVQINNENQELGRWEARKSGLERVEAIFDESDGYGLNQAMSEFWNAWQDLANNPSGLSERTALLEKGTSLTTMFQRMHGDLEQAQKEIDSNIGGAVEQINSLSGQIADLNKKIFDVEALGQYANDYRDKRDLLLKELSYQIDISAFDNDVGQVTVVTSGGQPLVTGDNFQSLSTQAGAGGLQNVIWNDGHGSAVDITDNIAGGKLKGWIEVRDVAISDYMTQLNDLAGAVISEVNNIHSSGFGLQDSVGGRAFFAGADASDIAVDTVIAGDLNLIAAAGNVGGSAGDNENAIAIANMQNELLMNGNSVTFDGFYNSLVSEVGSAVNTASSSYAHQSEMVTQLENYRESVSGVSLDEEMVNLVKFQHAYEAAAKLVSTVDELLDTVINMA
jgi:flagellar hook-associated protein 1 FlgK